MYCMLALFQASATLGFDSLQYADMEGGSWGDLVRYVMSLSVSVST